MKKLLVLTLLLAGCAETAPTSDLPEDGLAGPARLRTDCYASTVPPELAPVEIRDLPQC